MSSTDLSSYRLDFPLIQHYASAQPGWVYLDSGATTQKPQVVIDAITEGYTRYNANVHRGVYQLSREATDRHEAARATLAHFIGASDPNEVIFTRGTTEGLNLLASTAGETLVGPDDEVLITAMEHHANLVPWQQLCLRKGAHLRVAPLLADGSLDLPAFEALLTDRTKIVSVAHVSNVLGTVNPVAQLARLAHDKGAIIIVDGAQSAPHMSVNVQELGIDAYVCSSHKVYGPTGIGIVWGRRKLLEQIPPYQYGGEMIEHVSFEETTFNELPYKFEAGTPDFIGSHAFATAVEYISAIGLDRIHAYETELLEHLTQIISQEPSLEILGTAPGKGAVVTFISHQAHAYDLGLLLDQQGVALRTGHHCAIPLIEGMGHHATIRASLGLYNTHEDLEIFAKALHRALTMLG